MAKFKSSYNLWSVPWITLETLDGRLLRRSIQETLLQAHEFRSVFDPSPLVVVGIHRLLTAILQHTLAPQRPPDLVRLSRASRLPETDIHAFGELYAHRFDIFSEGEPFLQSADIPGQLPRRAGNLKPVTYLMPELPAGTEVTHYRHGRAQDAVLCPACAASGLVTIPPFATSGGAGMKPSINGVPPVYVLPAGDTLCKSLAASLVLPDYQPAAASREEDHVWWVRDPIVEHKAIVHRVGYLHSLTFPARRVRLYAEPIATTCWRCGASTSVGVRTMVYQMGESRPRDAPFWFDPFAAYRLRENEEPAPIRPVQGKALWREYAALFLPTAVDAQQSYRPPDVLYQLANEGLADHAFIHPFRCVGLRTDMKAKVFEWVDAGFDVPIWLVLDPAGGQQIHQGLAFASDCARIIARTFLKTFTSQGGRTHHPTLRGRMLDAYWATLAVPFRRFVLQVAGSAARQTAYRDWVSRVVAEAQAAFTTHSEMIGSDSASLRQRVTGRRICSLRLRKRRDKALAA
jgi:CRISPR system Cascade subunit CasA